MHLVYTVVVDGLPSESSSNSCLGPVSVSEMSLLQALGPVQTWLGQELEKCGIDAMIYTRYVLSLLLHDNFDYDLQEQENDIFLGWEKGAYKKWGKSKKKCSDLTLEEMKKQAAVQCLRSASDESSGIETLVEELCSRLKDLQSEQAEEKISKRLEDSLPPEIDLSPAAKDQVEMYYEAFPPLSQKPVCLQEIMTVWNKSKMCSYSSTSSSSTVPATSTDTSSPKDYISENEASKERNRNKAPVTIQERVTEKNDKDEKENKFGNRIEGKSVSYKKQFRHKSEGKLRLRSWSSGSSEEGSNSSGNHGELKAATKYVKIRHKTREARSKKGWNGQSEYLPKAGEKTERKIPGSSNGSIKQLCKRGKRPLKEIRRKEGGNHERKELYFDSRNETEYKEEPLWYTEPITEYFVPLSRKSKLETTYRNKQEDVCDATSEAVEELAESVQGLCISNNNNINKTYLAAGTFIDGHFVEMPAVLNEDIGLTRTSICSPPEDDIHLDGVHLSELTHFYEVDIDQSMLDSGASGKMQGESRILNMIRQKSREGTDFEAECCIVFDGMELKGESAIWADSATSGAEGWFLQDLSNLAQFWECCSSSSSGDADGESFGGDSPVTLSPTLDSTMLNSYMLAGNQELFSDTNEGCGLNSFSVFEVQCSNSVLPFPFEKLNLGNENADSSSNVGMFGKTQSRLLIWTKNSAFDENEHCSNLSTRTCSPWSYSEETRSDNETLNIPFEESPQFNSDDINYIVPTVSSSYIDEEIVDFLQEETCQEQTRSLGEIPTLIFTKKSKLESLCGIQLEQKTEDKEYETTQVCSDSSPHEDDYGSGVMKHIWTNMTDENSAAIVEIEGIEEELFPTDVNHYCCCLNDAKVEILQGPNKAVQRSEYHLWEGQKENLEKRGFASTNLSEVDCGDYTTPSKSWDVNQDKESSFILGGVYGELKTFNSDAEWAIVPPNHPKGNLLQCAASDVVTIAGTDVFMTPGNSFTPGHRQLWRPFVSFEQSEHLKCDHGLNRGFSFIFHEDLLEACSNFQGEESGLEYSFSSFDLNNPFSQVLHVECTFEPEGIASFSPCFKPKSILCSDTDRDAFRPRICGAGRTQYRAIRISPRTHFRPISASELSPCGGSESEIESEKDEGNILVSSQAEPFDDPQADLKPLEEDAEKEGHYYGKLELESGKFFPTLKKCGMEKSAQTSLDSQEESSGILLVENESSCLECSMKDVQDTMAVKNSEASCYVVEPKEEEDKSCSCKESSLLQLKELPVLSSDLQKISYNQAKQCWWEKALYTPLFPTSQYEDPLQVLCFWTPGMHVHQEPHCCNWGLKDKAPHIESELVDVGTEQLLDKEFQCDSLHLTSNQADSQHPQKQGSSHSLSCRQQERSIASAAAKCCTNIKRENSDEEFTDMKELLHSEDLLQDFNMVSSIHEARCADPRDSEIKSNGFRKKLYSSDSSSSEGAASEGGNGWTDPCEEELFSRTHL